jgi:hypothetical protein
MPPEKKARCHMKRGFPLKTFFILASALIVIISLQLTAIAASDEAMQTLEMDYRC